MIYLIVGILIGLAFGVIIHLLITNEYKRVDKMKLKPGDEVNFHLHSTVNGKVISDGELVTIEVKIPRHLVYKNGKPLGL